MLVKVKVVPSAKKEKIISKKPNVYELHIKEPAQQNLANNRARELLTEIYGINKGKVKLISGHRSPGKIFDVNLENK